MKILHLHFYNIHPFLTQTHRDIHPFLCYILSMFHPDENGKTDPYSSGQNLDKLFSNQFSLSNELFHLDYQDCSLKNKYKIEFVCENVESSIYKHCEYFGKSRACYEQKFLTKNIKPREIIHYLFFHLFFNLFSLNSEIFLKTSRSFIFGIEYH